MLQQIRKLFEKYKSLIVYLVFGVLTTAINYLVYLPLYNLAGFSAALSNIIAWVAAVIFAFLTNKPFVFKSYDWSASTLFPELVKFVSCRVGTGAVETGAVFLLVDCLSLNGNVVKLLTSVFVVVMNYVSGKLLVFRKKDT